MTTQGELPDIVERCIEIADRYSYEAAQAIRRQFVDVIRATPPGSPLIAEREAVKDLRIHRHAWRDALAELAENGVDTSVRAGDETYWQRELKVFDRVVAALTSPSPTEREGE